MLGPIIRFKVHRARESYLKEPNGYRKAEKRDKLIDMVGERFGSYRPNDAKRILDLGTTKKKATKKEMNQLRGIRNCIQDEDCRKKASFKKQQALAESPLA